MTVIRTKRTTIIYDGETCELLTRGGKMHIIKPPKKEETRMYIINRKKR